MLIPFNELLRGYESLIHATLVSNHQLYILASNDTDSICALRTLLNLLTLDNTPYTAFPVFSDSHLQYKIDQIVENQDGKPASLFLINCGGRLDLTEQECIRRKITIYVLDSHRPIHHNNIVGDAAVDIMGRVKILGDEDPNFENCPSRVQLKLLETLNLEDRDEED